MTPTDWIALTAIITSLLIAIGGSIVSLIVSVVGFWLSYKTNNENIKARRAQIAAEKSVEAYREIVEKFIDCYSFLGQSNLFTEQKAEDATLAKESSKRLSRN